MSSLNRVRYGLVAVTGLLLITVLAGCGAPAATPAASTAVPPAEAPAVPAATEIPATVAPTEVPAAAPTEAPTEAPMAAPTEAPTVAPAEAPAAAAVSFSKDILPMFQQSCLKCHGGDETKEGLSLKTYADLMKGSVNGAVIVPGNPADSELVTLVTRGKMPKRATPWSEDQVKLLTDWVAAGAPNN